MRFMFCRDGGKVLKCKECEKCCIGDNAPAVSLNELNSLPKPKARQIAGDLYRLDAPCQYHSNKGCTLDKKPLACELYPFYPTKDISKHPTWVVKTSCPHWREWSDEEIESIKMVFEENKEEFKDWN